MDEVRALFPQNRRAGEMIDIRKLAVRGPPV
jgi:hypothetical protein